MLFVLKGIIVEVHALKAKFGEVYPNAPEPAVCRAPGRVNLIGEHTDYNGLPVLPMAIAQEILIAVAPASGNSVRIHNVRPDFPPEGFANTPEIGPSAPGSSANYCKAAVQALNQYLEVDHFPGMDLLVASTLPIAAGLSSSSALVVGCALAYLHTLQVPLGENGISRLKLAELLAEAEHYVGTRGGGMDQTVILNGDAGHGCKINFFPLRLELTPLPEDCAIVVCDSMVKVQKSGVALDRYNAGPRQCALACALVARQVREGFGEEVALERLGDLWYGGLCLTYREAEELCLRAVPGERTPLAAAAKRLNATEEALRETYLGALPEPDGGFPLMARLRHQRTEYRRVEQARDALLAGDSQAFGALMNASHESCALDFEISSPELETLVSAARTHGALGARLTGAGFGGATVNLVPHERLEGFLEGIARSYYLEHLHYDGEPPVFVAAPSAGAGYVNSVS